jgi:hypothetical protein
VRSALLQAAQAAKLDNAWKAAGGKGRPSRRHVDHDNPFKTGELMAEYAEYYDLLDLKINGGTIRKHMIKWMHTYVESVDTVSTSIPLPSAYVQGSYLSS